MRLARSRGLLCRSLPFSVAVEGVYFAKVLSLVDAIRVFVAPPLDGGRAHSLVSRHNASQDRWPVDHPGQSIEWLRRSSEECPMQL